MKNIRTAIKKLAAEQKTAKLNRRESVEGRTLSQSDAATIHFYNRKKLRYLHAALWVVLNDGDFSKLSQIDATWKENLSESQINKIITEYA